ncbi:PIN domain-containing protein [Streptomyces canus]|uniref:hypothetical protein n=1 Tax=Streptomyces canus TaxID=58343 RepID=UPI00324D7765
MTLDRADAAPRLLIPSGSAFNPMVLDRRMLLPVLDTNALLVEACALAKSGGRQDRVTALAATGRATPYIAAHIPGEVDEHLAKVAADLEASERQARRVLNEQILPALRVVDLEIRDHLAPQTRHILRVDRQMPKRHRGDPDDAPTMAPAEFLGQCVIVSKDSVFSRRPPSPSRAGIRNQAGIPNHPAPARWPTLPASLLKTDQAASVRPAIVRFLDATLLPDQPHWEWRPHPDHVTSTLRGEPDQ